MGCHDAREIPNYWSYARNFVLQDHMFEPNSSWSLPEHLFQVSEWSAFCTNPFDAFSCTNALQSPNAPGRPLSQTPFYYNKFIEDLFLGGQRLNPLTDGRPDPRPDVREANPQLGDLSADFNFTQKPRRR